jgi:hypothetical protein
LQRKGYIIAILPAKLGVSHRKETKFQIVSEECWNLRERDRERLTPGQRYCRMTVVAECYHCEEMEDSEALSRGQQRWEGYASTELRDVAPAVIDCTQLSQRDPKLGLFYILVFYSKKLPVNDVT